MSGYIKHETFEPSDMFLLKKNHSRETVSLISSGSEFSGDGSDEDELDVQSLNPNKKQRLEAAVLPVGFLDPIRPDEPAISLNPTVAPISAVDGAASSSNLIVPVKEEVPVVVAADKGKETAVTNTVAVVRNCKQFWKAADYEECSNGGGDVSLSEMDHVRVHPRFLHSNATSHKWALGAFAELLDNALDEVCNGATYVNVDMVEKNENKMVVVQDNGGGMTPDKMRQCMSLGYSAKSKMANTIGQYGNGFKTSSMRLGADVIVFSRCQGKYGERTTQSIGLLSFTFLQNTGKEDIIVPMVDYEKTGENWNKRLRSSNECWQRNLETIVQWSPYDSEEEVLGQFNYLENQGTRIVIYNLWEDDEGKLELDFEADQNDIQTRGGNRDDKKLMATANDFPSSRHFLTYQHSLRSYASILYRKIPPGFSIILRGKEVEHHDVVDDIIHSQKHVYKPAAAASSKDPNMSAAVTLGFIKDASHHIDVQGFNVYHKNRLIRPFWRLWNAAGSDGRGVIGVLEANFVEPAHDKQGFERTTALSRLEAKLIQLQKTYWTSNCHLIGYAQRRHFSKKSISPEKEASPPSANDNTKSNGKKGQKSSPAANEIGGKIRFEAQPINHYSSSSSPLRVAPQSSFPPQEAPQSNMMLVKVEDINKFGPTPSRSLTDMVLRLIEDNRNLKNSLSNTRNELDYERDRNKVLTSQLQDATQMLQQIDREQETFVSSFAEERNRREHEEQNLRKRLREASETIEGLLKKVKILEGGFHN